MIHVFIAILENLLNINGLIFFIIASEYYFEVDVHDCKPHEKVVR